MLQSDQSFKRSDSPKETFFAPAARASREQLHRDIHLISKNPVIDTVMKSVGGLLAVLNEQRQILAVNDSLMDMLKLDDPTNVFGLRPGEALRCIHCHDEPGGCGTSQYCITCGAAIAIVTSLDTNQPAQKDCVARLEETGRKVDLYFQVRSYPLEVKGQRFLLLFMRDNTIQQQRAALERTFFHDINNTIVGLMLNSQLLELDFNAADGRELAKRIIHTAEHLQMEVKIQQILSDIDSSEFQLMPQRHHPRDVVANLREILSNHPAAQDKYLKIGSIPDVRLNTDVTLLNRVLMNMLINAFEATPVGGVVRLEVYNNEKEMAFHVGNEQVIPEEIALRIFQRNFSTKGGNGRGLGTYAMKLFGETYLGGRVDFVSNEQEGTTFRLRLPVET